MPQIKTILRNRFKDAKKIAVLGIGSRFWGDDNAGIDVAEELKKQVKAKNFRVFLGETAPENLTGQIKKFKPSHLVIIDAVFGRLEPGQFCLIDIKQTGGESFSTHRLPLKIVCDYLTGCIDCQITVIGLQPKQLEFGSGLSKEVKASVKKITEILKHSIAQKHPPCGCSKAKI